jgi:hypothetical protein
MADQFKRMSRERTVRGAAAKAGGTLRNTMQSLVQGDPSLKEYQDVAAAFHVWHDQKNVNVGLPPGHSMMGQAEKMHQSYQVSDVAMDLAKQSGEVEAQFIKELQDRSRAWYQKFLGMRGPLG